MSKQKTRYNFVKFLQLQIGGRRLYDECDMYDLLRESKDDRAAKKHAAALVDAVIDLQRLWVCVVYDMLVGLGIELPSKAFRRLCQQLNAIDVKLWFKALDACSDYLLEQHSMLTNKGLSLQRMVLTEDIADAKSFINSIDSILIPIRQQGSSPAAVFQCYRQIFEFPKRFSLDLPDLETTAYTSWLSTEHEGFELQENDPELQQLETIMSKWFPKTWNWRPYFDPKYGPGSVGDGGLADRQTKIECEDQIWSRNWLAQSASTYTEAKARLSLGYNRVQNCITNAMLRDVLYKPEYYWFRREHNISKQSRQEIRRLIAETLPDKFIEHLGYKSVYGASIGSYHKDDIRYKWLQTFRTAAANYALKQCGWESDSDQTLMQNPFCWFSYDGVSSGQSYCTVQFVPKSWKTFRTISAEPATQMWLQQGFGACIDHFLRSRRTSISKRYCLDTEYRNKHLAHLGSYDGCYATVDCSQASDRIWWKLVKRLFRNTWLRTAIWATRTRYALDPHTLSLIDQQKFAPMGSRMCFPIETFVFAGIAELACRLAGINTSEVEDPYVVYGDDTVIMAAAYNHFVRLLEKFGLKVNASKSFGSTSGLNFFRESCGGEYFNGKPLDIVRIPRHFHGIPSTAKEAEAHPARVAGLIDLCNRALDAKLLTARQYILYCLRDLSHLPLFFDSEGKRGLKAAPGTQVCNRNLKHRFNIELQVYEVYTWHLSVVKGYNSLEEDHRSDLVRMLIDESVRLLPNNQARYDDDLDGEQRLFETLRRTRRRTVKPGHSPELWPDDDIRVLNDPKADPTATLDWVNVDEADLDRLLPVEYWPEAVG